MKNINSNNSISSFTQFTLYTTASTQVLGGGRRSRRRAAKAAAVQAAELARQASELEGMAEDLIQDELLDDTTIQKKYKIINWKHARETERVFLFYGSYSLGRLKVVSVYKKVQFYL